MVGKVRGTMAFGSVWANAAKKGTLAASLQSKSWTPWQAPTTPPPGTYDPALDAAGGASQRGYDYLVGSTQDANSRATDEHGYQVQGLQRTHDRGLADIIQARTYFGEDQATANAREGAQYGLSVGRENADYGRVTGRENQDFGTATSNLQRSYTRLGARQAGAAAQAGVAGGGTLAAALRARSENQGIDQGRLDLQHTRFGEDASLSHDRYLQDAATQHTQFGENQRTDAARFTTQSFEDQKRIDENYGTDPLGAIGQADRQYGYGVNDRQTGLQQAGLENTNYQADLGDQRWFQFGQGGYSLPQSGEPGGRPSNEFTDPGGSPYRIVVRGQRRYRVAPDGTESFVGMRPAAR